MKNRFLLLLLVLLAGSIVSHAQNTSAIGGAVTDATGAVIAGAKVTVAETATGFAREVKTGSDGVSRAEQN